jgi:hypothetical protein
MVQLYSLFWLCVEDQLTWKEVWDSFKDISYSVHYYSYFIINLYFNLIPKTNLGITICLVCELMCYQWSVCSEYHMVYWAQVFDFMLMLLWVCLHQPSSAIDWSQWESSLCCIFLQLSYYDSGLFCWALVSPALLHMCKLVLGHPTLAVWLMSGYIYKYFIHMNIFSSCRGQFP